MSHARQLLHVCFYPEMCLTQSPLCKEIWHLGDSLYLKEIISMLYPFNLIQDDIHHAKNSEQKRRTSLFYSPRPWTIVGVWTLFFFVVTVQSVSLFPGGEFQFQNFSFERFRERPVYFFLRKK